MIEGILKDAADGIDQERIAMNSVYAQMKIFAEAYITIDGVSYTGLGASYSMYDILKTVADHLNEYYTQGETMQKFMTQWSAKGLIGQPWDSLNFQVSEDVLKLNGLYAGLQPYYGELHDHAATGGTSDGAQTLDVWKSELNRLNMDFATIVDHRQVEHMYHPDFIDGLFLGGTEPGTRITDMPDDTGRMHYNMLFADPEPLVELLLEFPEYQYGGNITDRFKYPGFTRERFTKLVETVLAKGGFYAELHQAQFAQ